MSSYQHVVWYMIPDTMDDARYVPNVDDNMHLNFRHGVLRQRSVFSRTFGCGARKGVVGTLRCMSGSQPNSVAVL